MRTIHFILFFLLSLQCLSQENPWINTTEKNPWSSKPNSVESDSSKMISSTEITDTVKLPIAIPSKDSTSSTINLEMNSIDYAEEGYNSTKAKGSFAAGLIFCGLLNIVGVIPSMIVQAIPTSDQLHCSAELKEEYPDIQSKQVRSYKKGISKKRFLKTLAGNLAGITLNFFLLLIFLN